MQYICMMIWDLHSPSTTISFDVSYKYYFAFDKRTFIRYFIDSYDEQCVISK